MCTSSASTRSFSEKKDNDPTEEHNIRACVKKKKKKKIFQTNSTNFLN